MRAKSPQRISPQSFPTSYHHINRESLYIGNNIYKDTSIEIPINEDIYDFQELKGILEREHKFLPDEKISGVGIGSLELYGAMFRTFIASQRV